MYVERDSQYPVLTAKEQAWARRLERVLLAAPRRLHLYTIGDRDLHIIDGAGHDATSTLKGHAMGDMGPLSVEYGFALGRVKSAVPIHSCAG